MITKRRFSISMTWKLVFGFLIFCCFSINAQEIKKGEKKMVDAIFEVNSVVCPSFMGFGVEWDPGVWYLRNPTTALTEEDWALLANRISWMRIPVVRIMMQTKWCYLGGEKYDWETPAMKLLYRHLDLCQKQGIKVILTDWGCEPGWLKAPDITDVGDPRYAKAIGTYMNHLLNTKKYTCIKYFVMGNEPNLEVKEFSRWKKGAEQVSKAFVNHGLEGKVGFMGSDESENQSWHRQAVDQLQTQIAAYDFHRYARKEELTSGSLYELIRAEWAYALTKDPQAQKKQCLLSRIRG